MTCSMDRLQGCAGDCPAKEFRIPDGGQSVVRTANNQGRGPDRFESIRQIEPVASQQVIQQKCLSG